MKFLTENIRIASISDTDKILELLNLAYRGEESKKGWTTEAELIDGNQRSTLQQISSLMNNTSVFLVYEENGIINGCVNLQHKNLHTYLGMFAVNPLIQNKGIGKKILLASEEYSRTLHFKAIEMTVIYQRIELINWYIRHGYKPTGKTIPFKEDGVSGKHLQPLHFIVLQKILS